MSDATEPLNPLGDFSVPEDADLHVDGPTAPSGGAQESEESEEPADSDGD